MVPEHEGEPARPLRASLEVDGGRIAYETSGKGPAVLFLHSVIADGRMWDREVARASRGHQAIRFDLRGFGDSSPARGPYSNSEDIRSLLEHLKVPRALLVGSSLGGALAIDLALRYPQLAQSLLLVAPGLSGGILPPYSAEEQEALAYDDRKSQEVAAAWSKGDTAAAIERLRELWGAALKGPALDLFRTMVEANAVEVFENRSLQKAIDPPPAEPRLARLRVPTTVLVGDRDNPSSISFARRIARAVPGARLETVPGGDHLLNLSRPAPFERALLEAMASVG